MVNTSMTTGAWSATSMTTGAWSATLIDAQCATVDRYRVSPISIVAVSAKPVSQVIDVEPLTISPVFAAFMGEVRPEACATGAVVEGETSLMNRHRGTSTSTSTSTTTVFGAFDKFAVDIQNRVGPPPPSRQSV